ncbi:mechanosensitive ion channel domain-containing protein [Natrinema salsiterrestre]|uniref:Mechanosensitive ion channel n=1 Tax=Natrinema salsiterrestre TaxID=2950540 RepID=A0A9Q4L681_9EURY|nr:mechanosensitive ion channel domain-containing protein [Natrinema salsiterrestre]MDF9746705.1 mechanosensitive ion channel [Natrinema salsiterrestre]
MLIQAVSEPTDEPVPSAILSELIDDTITALPKVISGVLFLVVAYLLIKVALWVTRSVLERMHPDEQRLIVDLSVTIVGVFLWFGAALAFLKIVGLGDVAASLGTAGGFIGLGVAFALKEMIADTVAGIYLLRDPDFEVGDTVNTASVTGTVAQIDLRKTRIRADDGTLVVLANRDVEKKWTNESSAASGSRVEAPAE